MKNNLKVAFPTKAEMDNLLAAVHNISPEADGHPSNDGAMDALDMVYDLLAHKSKDYRWGVIAALRLFVETTCAKSPSKYAIEEAERGFDGVRHQDESATIALPQQQ